MTSPHVTIKERWLIGKQFLSNAPCVLRVAYSEAKKQVLGEESVLVIDQYGSPDAIILPFTVKEPKVQKYLDAK